MSLSSAVNIENNSQMYNDNFSMIDTYGKMIVNQGYGKGYRDFANGFDTRDGFIYKVLSAAGNDVADTLYLNIKKYIDLVADVNLCKLTGLRSMLNILGFKKTIYDNLGSLPIGIRNLIDLLSINRKYLIKKGMLRKQLFDDMMQDEYSDHHSPLSEDDNDRTNFKRFFEYNSLMLSVSDNVVSFNNCDIQKLVGAYECSGNALSNINQIYEDVPLSTYAEVSGSTSYINRSGYFISYGQMSPENETSVYSLFNDKAQKLMAFDDSMMSTLQYVSDSQTMSLCDLYVFAQENAISDVDDAFMLYNKDYSIMVSLSNMYFRDDLLKISDDEYERYLKYVYFTYISQQLTNTYNADFILNTQRLSSYIYPYLGNMYFNDAIQQSFDVFDNLGDSADNILSLKMFYHIPRSFDEKKIYDQIEDGDDYLENYAGIELSILMEEKKRREQPLDFTKLTEFGVYGIDGNSSKLPQTRYSYYREKKVTEYAKFVDSYFSSIWLNPKIYDFDNNYFVVTQTAISNVIEVLDARNPNPDNDINWQMVDVVAEYLASFTMYSSKIRDKIKLQTQKNYMKGTNLLMIYVINEYLNEYAKHNAKFFLEQKTDANGDPVIDSNGNPEYKYPELALSVYPMLNGHQFSDDGGTSYSIDIGEYYDRTEYFNISTETSLNAGTQVNKRYWELTSVSKPAMMGYDGLSFRLSEIEKFYLSTLNLKQTIDDSHDGMVNFLSTLYDLGASPSFIGDDQLFSSKLADGSYAHEIYDRLVRLSSSFNQFEDYLSAGDYDYIDDVVSAQVSDAMYNYIFPNLSNAWLSGVSTVYKANIRLVNDISTSMMRLSSDYGEFISGTYSYYYAKSNHKWCYEYQDPVAGSYLFNYYINSPEHDTSDMTLHQHLQSLLAYSQDPANIQNHALNCVIDYIYTNFNQVSSDLKSKVISKLTSTYNFVDIKAPNLGDELQYTYDYVNDLIASRKKQIEDGLANAKAQASNLKSQYDQLNNTFTAAIASFNDNNPGYKLGDDYVFEVTVSKTSSWPSRSGSDSGFSEDETGKCDVSDNSPPNKKHDNVLFVPNLGRWYILDGKGDYMYAKNVLDAGNVYNPSSSLLERCNQVKAYMNMPTSITNAGDESFGLMNDGTAASIDNVLKGLDDLEVAFDATADVAEMYGVNVNWESTDIYAQINELVMKLNSIDATTINDDALNQLNSFLKEIVQLSGSYLPLKQHYEGIFTDSEQSKYLANFQPNMEMTLEHVEDLKNYTYKTDLANQIGIMDQVNKICVTDFDALMDKLNAEIDYLTSIGINLSYPTDMIVEKYIEQMSNALLQDVLNKTENGNYQINTRKQNIFDCIGIIYSEIKQDIFTQNGFVQSVKSALSRLNFFDHDIYKKWHQVFLTYGGKQQCYDPYYNIKNQTHSTYQIHPFLWNLVQKASTDTLIERGFKAGANIGEEYTLNGLHSYIGDFGQTIDLWKNYQKNRVDYSGYTTRYEKSDNKSPTTGDVNEVVDYDGAFYPPAADMFIENSAACIHSVYEMACVYDIQKQIDQVLTNDITEFLVIDNNGKVISDRLYSSIQSILDRYVVSNDIKQRIAAYMSDNEYDPSKMSMDDIRSLIGVGLSQSSTFYEKYYKHLSMSRLQYQHIANQLEEYADAIKRIIGLATPKTVYDIYKYGLDMYGNSYILYKQYDYSTVEEYRDLSYKQKQDTLGTMWIRLAHHPMAFPAFSGKNPQCYIYKSTMMNPALLKLASSENGIVYHDKYRIDIDAISSDMKFFYDFEFTQDHTALMYVVKNGNMPNYAPFNEFGLGWVITDRIHTTYDKNKDLEWLHFTNATEGSQTYTIDYIDFNSIDSPIIAYRNKHDIFENLDKGVRYPVLVGYYVYDQYSIDLVYVYKKFQQVIDDSGKTSIIVTISNADDKDERIEKLNYDATKAFFIVKIRNGTTISVVPSNNPMTIQCLKDEKLVTINGVACAGWDNTTRTTKLAFLTQLDDELSNVVEPQPTISAIDFYENSEGPVIHDPMSYEMNSHDVFNQNVTVVSFRRKTHNLSFIKSENYNINADISYIPSYPGISGEIDIYNKYTSPYDYYNVELLGMSKDIDYYINLVNPNPDPFFDYDAIVRDTIFGRVWEDYDENEEDKTILQLYNPSLNKNMPNDDGSYTPTYQLVENKIYRAFDLRWNLNNLKHYSKHDLEMMEVLIFNVGSLGKNPYFVGKLNDLRVSNLIDQNLWKNMNYSSIQNGCAVENVISCESASSAKVTSTGVRRRLDTTGSIDSNMIDHITDMKAAFWMNDDGTDAVLVLRFFYDSFEYAHVPQNQIKVVLFNVHDLSIFKYCHMLDAHGVVQCKYLEEYLESPDIDFDGWGICYDKTKYKHEELSDLLKSYYITESGHKQWLADVELSNYDALSDVYILNGTNRLGFKVDEEIYFDISSDLYWYPTLNISYPRTAADYIAHNSTFQNTDATDLNILSGIYNDYNMFIIDVDDPNELVQNIGQVDIPLMFDDSDDIRVFEDFLDIDEQGIPNYEKFDNGDSRLLEFVHATSDNMPKQYSYDNILDVADDIWKNKAFVDVNTIVDDANGIEIFTAKSEDQNAANNLEFISFTPLSSNSNILEQLKIYASYKRDRTDNDSLTLYFNYYNYINSPYLKIDNSHDIKLDIIDGTYLKLKAGENGILDLVLQFRYYNGKQLIGYKNCKITSYHIYNISDDKPKFLIQKIYQAEKDSFKNKYGVTHVNLELASQSTIDLNEIETTSSTNFQVVMNVDYDQYLSAGWDFYMYYPNSILSIDTGVNAHTVGYMFDQENCDIGLAHVIVSNPLQQNLVFNFVVVGGYTKLMENINRAFDISIDEPNIIDIHGNQAEVETTDTTFIVKKTHDGGVLVANTEFTPPQNDISAIIIDRLNNLLQVD